MSDTWKIIVRQYALKSQYPRAAAKRIMNETIRENINSRPAFKDVTSEEISAVINEALLEHPDRPQNGTEH